MNKLYSGNSDSAESHNVIEGVMPGGPIRALFPIFGFHRPGDPRSDRPLSYLDTAASSQKPVSVIERMDHYLRYEHANIHRGAYALSAEATLNYDAARVRVAKFLNVPASHDVIFTRGTTESINLVAYAGEGMFAAGDTVLLSILEHHSNIVPWQLLQRRRGIKIVFSDVDKNGVFNLDDFKQKLKSERPKFVSVTAVSNALGTVVPIKEVVAAAKNAGAMVLVDAAQAVPHGGVDVAALEADFVAFSGHKLYGPTGIGVLCGRRSLLEKFEPFMGGGDMIRTVATTGSTWAASPQKFEAGTPAIAEAIGLATALDFVDTVGAARIQAHEKRMFDYGWALLGKEAGVTRYGPAVGGGAQQTVLSFNVEGVHPHDFATIADELNVQVRAGHHCAMPLLERLGLPATVRASIGVYTTEADFDALVEAVQRARKMFGTA